MASVGETLRTAREQRGLSIEQVSHDTRISPRFVEALEADRFDALPAPVYVRGFIRSYASYLRLDGAALVARLSSESVSEPAGGGAPAQAGDARRVDPFRRQAAPPREDEGQPLPWPGRHDTEPRRTETPAGRRAGVAPGRPIPPPAVPPDALDDIDEDGLVRRRQAPILGEEVESRSRGRNIALVAIGLAGIAIAVVTAIVLTGGDNGPVATIAPDETPTRASGTVVVVETRTPASDTSPTPGTATPEGTRGGAPEGSPSPTAENGGQANESTPTAPGGSASTPGAATPSAPTPTLTPTVPAPTATPTAQPTPTPFPTATPTLAPQPPHPMGYEECLANNGDCGDPPLRVVCVPDGTWFVDVPPYYAPLHPGWREVFVTQSSQAMNAC